MVPLDAVIAASILCWNPFKPGPEAVYREAAGEARTALLDRKRDRRTLVYGGHGLGCGQAPMRSLRRWAGEIRICLRSFSWAPPQGPASLA